jgi:hypothetical protein
VYRQLADEDRTRARVSGQRGIPGEAFTRSALAVFDYAIHRLDSERWEAYYGLALAHWSLAEWSVGDRRRRLNRVIGLCDRALQVASGRAARAQIQDLKAMAQHRCGSDRDKAAALATRHSAASSVLRELARAELWHRSPIDGQRILRLRKQASQCLMNLAIAYDAVEPPRGVKPATHWFDFIHTWRRARRLARIHALAGASQRLADVGADAHAKFAEIERRWGKLDAASRELQRAIQIDSGNPTYFALRAEMLCALNDSEADQACHEAEHAIDYSATEQEDIAQQQEAMKRLTTAYKLRAQLSEKQRKSAIEAGEAIARRRNLGLNVEHALARNLREQQLEKQRKSAIEAGKAIARRRKLRSDIARALAHPEARTKLRELNNRVSAQLSHRPARRKTDRRNWDAALIERHRAQQLLESADTNDPKGAAADAQDAEELFRSARDRLEDLGYRGDIRRWGLLGDQARAIARQSDRTGDALPLAERGVAIDPLSSAAWRALAIVREHGEDYERACAAWHRAHLLEPEDPQCRVQLALCQWQQAMWVPSATKRRSLLREALEHLDGALRLYDTAQVNERRQTEWWSAMCLWSLGEFAAMPSHLRCILASLDKIEPNTTPGGNSPTDTTPDGDASAMVEWAKETAFKALVELMLAKAYRNIRRFGDAESYAQRAIIDGKKAADGGFPEGKPVVPRMPSSSGAPILEEKWPLGAVQVLARAELAGCHLDRNGSTKLASKNLHEAEQLVRALKAKLGDVTEVENEVLTERGRLELAFGETREAIHHLERATGLDPSKADSYVALACAYEKLATEETGEDIALALKKARDSCGRAKEIVGASHVLWDAADQVEQRLEAYTSARLIAAAVTAAALTDATDRLPQLAPHSVRPRATVRTHVPPKRAHATVEARSMALETLPLGPATEVPVLSSRTVWSAWGPLDIARSPEGPERGRRGMA